MKIKYYKVHVSRCAQFNNVAMSMGFKYMPGSWTPNLTYGYNIYYVRTSDGVPSDFGIINPVLVTKFILIDEKL
jgi:hypothetical protein